MSMNPPNLLPATDVDTENGILVKCISGTHGKETVWYQAVDNADAWIGIEDGPHLQEWR